MPAGNPPEHIEESVAMGLSKLPLVYCKSRCINPIRRVYPEQILLQEFWRRPRAVTSRRLEAEAEADPDLGDDYIARPLALKPLVKSRRSTRTSSSTSFVSDPLAQVCIAEISNGYSSVAAFLMRHLHEPVGEWTMELSLEATSSTYGLKKGGIKK